MVTDCPVKGQGVLLYPSLPLGTFGKQYQKHLTWPVLKTRLTQRRRYIKNPRSWCPVVVLCKNRKIAVCLHFFDDISFFVVPFG